MTPPDDLKPGMCVALVRIKEEDAAPQSPFFFLGEERSATKRLDGRPLEILAINLPFVAVTDGRRRFAIDLRQYDVQKLSRAYVQSFWDDDAASTKPGRQRRKAKRNEKPDPSYCQRCGERLIQLLIPGAGWQIVCRQCGMNGGPAPKGGL
jgi:hypothetical protein